MAAALVARCAEPDQRHVIDALDLERRRSSSGFGRVTVSVDVVGIRWAEGAERLIGVWVPSAVQSAVPGSPPMVMAPSGSR
ncbi:MAG: hypothetical protein ACRDRH_16590 [Pseudonocardia sp.]